MQIPINSNLESTLTRLAIEQNTTPELYASGVLEGYLISRMKEHTVKNIDKLTIQDLKEVTDDIIGTVDVKVPKNLGTSEVSETPIIPSGVIK